MVSGETSGAERLTYYSVIEGLEAKGGAAGLCDRGGDGDLADWGDDGVSEDNR